MTAETNEDLQMCLERMEEGDLLARDQLIALACPRLFRIAERMLQDYPRLKRWEQAEDVFQNAVMRLRRSLEQLTPRSPSEFYGLAATHIRRELKDLTRHYYGRRRRPAPSGDDRRRLPARSPAHLVSMSGSEPGDARWETEGHDCGHDPADIAAWTEFHQRAQSLPPAEREVFDLLIRRGLSQREAAGVLRVDKSTVKRRWRSARAALAELLQAWLPAA